MVYLTTLSVPSKQVASNEKTISKQAIAKDMKV
jgi:hypothetical protein